LSFVLFFSEEQGTENLTNDNFYMQKHLIIIVLMVFLCACCNDDAMPDDETGGGPVAKDLTGIPYNPTDYVFPTPEYFPDPILPPDNPLTHEGIELGRRLFYDPILSADSTMSCASCHSPSASFADNEVLPVGIDGIEGRRNTMALINLAFIPNNKFNWDGKSPTLEGQAIEPVENPVELHEDWGNVEDKLRRHNTYPEYFRKAFGIDDTDGITRELATQAIAQFELTLVSSDSYYDRAVVRVEPGVFFEEDQRRGMKLFMDEGATGLKDAQCWHCHSSGQRRTLFTNGGFFNNGLDSVGNLTEFTDLGHGAVTGNLGDNGKFKSPSLRNVALTAPYMHDGRFATLEEVLDHYADGGHPAPNVDAFVPIIDLNEQEKADIIAFLHALTDTTFTKNPAYQNPF